MKQEFKMTQEKMDDIIAINKSNMPVLRIGNVTTLRIWLGRNRIKIRTYNDNT